MAGSALNPIQVAVVAFLKNSPTRQAQLAAQAALFLSQGNPKGSAAATKLALQLAELAGKITGIFDHVPDEQAFPYLQIGEPTESPQNSFCLIGRSATFVLHAFSRGKGWKEAEEITSLAISILELPGLAVAGWSLVDLSWENTSSQENADGITRQLISRFRVIVQETEV